MPQFSNSELIDMVLMYESIGENIRQKQILQGEEFLNRRLADWSCSWS